jgi:hypothetical protein
MIIHHSREMPYGRAIHKRVPHGRTPPRRVLYGRVYVSKFKKALGKTSRSPTLQTVVDLLRLTCEIRVFALEIKGPFGPPYTCHPLVPLTAPPPQDSRSFELFLSVLFYLLPITSLLCP